MNTDNNSKDMATLTDGEKRVERAIELFKSGFNCSQSVVAAFADLYGFTEEQALRMSASFGGGIGRMRQTCGAACGVFMLAGLETGSTKAGDKAGKAANYELVQQLAERFKAENGSLICAELLGLHPAPTTGGGVQSPSVTPKPKRPCVKMVESAARMWQEYYNSMKK